MLMTGVLIAHTMGGVQCKGAAIVSIIAATVLNMHVHGLYAKAVYGPNEETPGDVDQERPRVTKPTYLKQVSEMVKTTTLKVVNFKNGVTTAKAEEATKSVA